MFESKELPHEKFKATATKDNNMILYKIFKGMSFRVTGEGTDLARLG